MPANTKRVFGYIVAAAVLSTVLYSGFGVFIGRPAYAADDKWYVGEGAQKDMWVRYKIQEHDTNNARPFEMIIWFKEQDPDGTWTAPTWVVDQGKVINGTLKLGNNLASMTAGADIPDEMRPYIGGYQGSLQWLEGFTSKEDPRSLTQPSWGKIAAIGGAEVKPMGTEKVTVPAGSYDTTVVGWLKGVQNKIWIMNEFPYPIKAETFAEVTSGQPPPQFIFELVATGKGQPPAIEASAFAPKPPLKEATGRGTFNVNLDWNPPDIQPGSAVTFTISFTDNNGRPVERVNYDFTAKDANGKVIQEFKDQNTDPESGAAEQKVSFEKGGPVEISVIINTAEGQLAGGETGFIERSDFNIVVVPEFPVGAALIVSAAVGLIVVLARMNKLPVGRLER